MANMFSRLIIWNKTNAEELKIDIEEKKGRDIFSDSMTNLVMNYTEFEHALNVQKKGYGEFYILCELDWVNNGEPESAFYGYEVFKEMHSKGVFGKGNISVLFCSSLPRKRIIEIAMHNNNPNLLIIKKFPHYCLDEYSIPNHKLSRKKYDLLIHQCVQSFGVIDKLIHDFRHCVGKTVITKNHIDFIRFIKYSESLLRSEFELLKIINILWFKFQSSALNIDTWNKYEFTIGSLLQQMLPQDTNWQNWETKLLSPCRILLVEDDTVLLESFQRWLEAQGAIVTALTSGTEAIEELKQKGASHYDILCTDLELIIDEMGCEDPIHGIDLIEYIEKKSLPMVIRIITGMPKRTASLFLKGYSIIYKNNAEFVFANDNECDNFLNSLVSDIQKTKRSNLIFTSPQTTSFKKYVNIIYQEKVQNNLLDDILDRVQKTVKKFFIENDEIGFIESDLTVKETKEESLYRRYERKFDLILIHRLIVLLLIYKNNLAEFSIGKFDYFGYAIDKSFKFSSKSKNIPKPIPASFPIPSRYLECAGKKILSFNPKSLLNIRLGFVAASGKGLPDSLEDQYVYINVDEDLLYPHENEILNELKELSEEKRKEKYGF